MAQNRSVDDLRFVIVTGKGGVGKTTVCAAQAMAMAARGKRVLICLCNTKERLSTMLGSVPVGGDVTPVLPNVWAVNMEPDKALEEYGLLTLKSRALYKMLFDNDYVRTFLRAIPGMQEWTLLGKAWWHTTEQLENGQPKFDVVILDAPATGHGLDMLRVPKVLVDIVPSGLLRRDAEIAWKLFQNPALTGTILVTLPEEMPTSETLELAAALTSELNIPIAKLVINAVVNPLFSAGERQAMGEALAASTAADAGAKAQTGAVATSLQTGHNRAERERVQAESTARLRAKLPVETVALPMLYEKTASPSAIALLAKHL
jgi:anion-transporting  ArsA/GET3 family ATPase